MSYTAPSASTGHQFVQIADSLGNTVTSTAQIAAGISLSTGTTDLTVGDTRAITVSGGFEPYNWVASTAVSTSILGTGTNSITFLVSSVGTASISLTDSESNQASQAYSVGLALSLTGETVQARKRSILTVTGGIGTISPAS